MAAVVAFVSQKGGVGKSTLARALAALAAKSKVRTLVGDLDAQQSTLVHWESTRREKNVAPALDVRRFDGIDDALSDAGAYELLIVDTSGHASRATLDVASNAHLVVQPTGPGLDDLRPGVLLFHELIDAGIPRSRLAFALVRTSTKEEEAAARIYLEKADYAVLPGSIPERATYRAAHNTGRAITETDDATLNARAQELLEAMLERLRAEIEVLKEGVRMKRVGKGTA
jgi:chromosome partitioning protein